MKTEVKYFHLMVGPQAR